jgi:hypothetical protein
VKKVLLGGALMGVAALGVTGPASASVKQSPVQWNVKCENIAKLHLRKGVDCAHTLKNGQHWDFPKGVRFQKDFTTSGTALSIQVSDHGRGRERVALRDRSWREVRPAPGRGGPVLGLRHTAGDRGGGDEEVLNTSTLLLS